MRRADYAHRPLLRWRPNIHDIPATKWGARSLAACKTKCVSWVGQAAHGFRTRFLGLSEEGGGSARTLIRRRSLYARIHGNRTYSG